MTNEGDQLFETGWMPPPADPEVDAVITAIRSADPDGVRFAAIVRATYDQIYDGQHTGRFSVDQLTKTEKTHIGTIIEINLQREFAWEDGDLFDYRINGVDIDCKFAQRFGTWMIPPELYDNEGLALLVWADDHTGRWSVGVTRISLDVLNAGENRDRKKSIRAEALRAINWIWRDEHLPENVLLHLPEGLRNRVMGAEGEARNSGAARIRSLFRLVQGRIINRATVLTVAQQDDSMKRLRDARLPQHLGGEGIIILGHWSEHQNVARDLGLDVPRLGDLISARVVPAEPGYGGRLAEIEGSKYRLARDDDPVVPAPNIPWKADALES